MSIKVALATKLKSISALTAIVSTRIYSVALPQDFTLPAVTFRMVADETMRTLAGHSGKARTTFEITSFATTDTAAESTGEIIRKALDGMAPATISTVKVRSVSMTDRSDDYDSDINVFGRIMTFKIAFEEATT